MPLSANFKARRGEEIEIAGRELALREEVGRVLADEPGEWEVRVQLCRDLEANPMEDASTPWPENGNPYVAVAVIRVHAQPSWTLERSQAVDDRTAFMPWHGLAVHRLLGGIMRARRLPQ